MANDIANIKRCGHERASHPVKSSVS
jgi:hypothetical protein